MKEKKKKTVRIVDKTSTNYTFTDDNLFYRKPTDEKEYESRQTKNDTKTSIKDVKDQNRHKTTSKKIRSLQGHSPVYE